MIYLTGDTHADYDIKKLSSKAFPEFKTLTKKDYVIILGDFGLLWKNKPDGTEIYWLNWLHEKPWSTLFIDGNHENFDRINKLEEVPMFGSKVGYVNDSVFHLKRGHVYTIQDKKFLTIGGAQSIDKLYRTPGITWWREELLSHKEQEMLFNTIEQNPNVDYVLSHTCPNSVYQGFGFNRMKSEDPTMKILEEVRVRVQFKEWYFGHFHVDRFMKDGFRCLYECVIPLIF